MKSANSVLYLTDPLLDETGRLLASFAAEVDSEGVVYWFGLELRTKAIVTTLVVPAADTTGGRISTSAAANADAIRLIVGTPLVLLGQAHSHPSRNVNHSWVDDRDTFAQFPGAISVVVPHFARRGIHLSACGVYRHLDGGFRRIGNADVAAHLRVLPGAVDLRPKFNNV